MWRHRFGYVREAERGRAPGAAHASESPLLFGNPGVVDSVADRVASGLLQALVVSFATDGKPSAPQLGAWPTWHDQDQGQGQVLIIDTPPIQTTDPHQLRHERLVEAWLSR